MAFILKKVMGILLMPLPVIVFLAVAGTVLLWRGRWPRVARALVTGSTVLLLVLSFRPLANVLVRGQEWRYSAFPGDSVAYVVVLGSGHRSDPRLPTSARLGGQSLFRLVEGMRIARAQPWTKLVLSGWGGEDPVSNAEVSRGLALELGVDPERILIEPRPRDTREEAEYIQPLVGDRPVALVTSAVHMHRAVAHFRARGVRVLPAPTAHITARPQAPNLLSLAPSPSALVIAHRAWHEALGSVWARLGGQVP